MFLKHQTPVGQLAQQESWLIVPVILLFHRSFWEAV